MLLDRYAGELRADFRRVYGLDLMALHRGEMGLFEASDLAAYLPAGSAVWRAEGGPMAWTDETHMLSAGEYNTHVLWWMKTKDGSKGTKPPTPHQPPKSKSQEAADEARVTARVRKRRARAQ